MEAGMCYARLLSNAFGGKAVPFVIPEAKFFQNMEGLNFPVLFSHERATRPFRAYESQTRQNCSLCAATAAKRTSTAVVNGMEWLAASWPIKAFHGICYPAEHRATILCEDICKIGAFIESAGDAVACINIRGSGASVPEHFHVQLHDNTVLTQEGVPSEVAAFPLLTCAPVPVKTLWELTLYRLPTYPTFALVLQGAWELLGRWMITYLSATNMRPHNFALVPGRRLVVIPRGLEKASSQENRYGASEMLGLVSPVTREAFYAIQNTNIIIESLCQCGLNDHSEQVAVEEHAAWVMEHLYHESSYHR
jgi:hypothetical protein